MEIKTLRDVVIEEMQSDDSYSNHSDCKLIKQIYENDSLTNRIAVDTIFIRLVGFSLSTLLMKYENQTKE